MTLKPDASYLSLISLLIGLITLAPGIFTLIFPGKAVTCLKLFPRSIWAGRVLSTICLIWSVLWICLIPLGPLLFLRQFMWLLLPISILAVWFFIPELLACRSIGGLLVLLPAPMLSSAAWHPSPFRYLVIVYAYAMCIAGMFYIASPWRLRNRISLLCSKPDILKITAIFSSVFGIILVLLSLTVYKI
ncbi:MAG: hypothetical protein GX804_08520 [Lentisphaerae bacterium]|jgi:hypothetical protein|nr:hypothetical protein [Lentisphaerota bacterium]